MDISEILTELNDSFEDTVEARKVSVINEIISDICSREPWPFLEATAAVNITAGNNTPTVPTDLRAVLTFSIDSERRVLQPERTDTMMKGYNLTATGDPLYYYFVGEELRLWPVPTRALTGTLFYLKNHPKVTSTTLEAAILIPARHHPLITLGSFARLYAREDDGELAVMFERLYEQRLKTMQNDTWKKQYDRPDRIVDLWADDYDLF